MGSPLDSLRHTGVVLGYWIAERDLKPKQLRSFHPALNQKLAELATERILRMFAILRCSPGITPCHMSCECGGKSIFAIFMERGALLIACGSATLDAALRQEILTIVQQALRQAPLKDLQAKDGTPDPAFAAATETLLDTRHFPPRLHELIHNITHTANA